MAWRLKSGVYVTQLTLEGYGTIRRMSLRTTRKSDALALEGAIIETYRRSLGRPAYRQLLDAIQGRDRELTPVDLLYAVRSADPAEALDELLSRLTDPLLLDVLRENISGRYDPMAYDNIASVLVELFGPEPRLSIITKAVNIDLILVRVQGDRLANSVVRYEKQFISRVLDAEFGRGERNRIMAEVRFSGSDDRRRIRESVVTPIAIARLCDAMLSVRWHEDDDVSVLYIQIAATTGAEIGPLSRTINRDYEDGVIFLRGTKKIGGREGGRDREIVLPSALAKGVSRYHRPHAPDDALFPLAKSRFDTMFQRARRKAGLMEAVLDGRGRPTPIRPHDLRRVFAAFAERAQIDRTKISVAGLGHSRMEMTDRYLLRETTLERAEVDRVAELLGF